MLLIKHHGSILKHNILKRSHARSFSNGKLRSKGNVDRLIKKMKTLMDKAEENEVRGHERGKALKKQVEALQEIRHAPKIMLDASTQENDKLPKEEVKATGSGFKRQTRKKKYIRI